MIDSPFRQPHQRQEALRRLLQMCRAQGDQRAVGLIEMQWVHRYGVASLPALSTAAAPMAAASVSTFAVLEAPIAPADPIPPSAPLVESAEQPSTVPAPTDEIPSSVHRFRTLLRDGLDAVSATVDQDRGELTPPPSPSLKRLRRWLPMDGADLPKAS